MPSPRRIYFLGPLVILFCSILAGVKADTADDQINQSIKSFTKIYDAVEKNFADPVKPEKAIYGGAIPGMLNTLDPHSHFLDPKEFSKNREDLSERYYGIGALIGGRSNKIF